MNKKLIAGLILAGVFTYLSLRNMDLGDVLVRLSSIEYSYLIAALLIIILIQLIRAFRWGMIMSPLGKIAPWDLLAITSIGLLAVVALPARLGEVVRAYLVTRKTAIPMSSALATILVERVLDSIAIVVMAAAVLIFVPLPPWMASASAFFSLITLALIALIFLALIGREKVSGFLTSLIAKLPGRYAEPVKRLIKDFIDGFKILVQEKKIFKAAVLSAIIWLLHVLVIVILFEAFRLPVPLIAAFVLNIVLIVGIAIPAAPGFVGNWHYSSILGLGIFGIAQGEALSFAVVHHFLAVSVVILMGLIFAFTSGISLTQLKREAKGQESGVGT
ncbi:MAG: lysylphosphatidylglycerol synthase transmembrane domain-containing protein [Smithellaceae bacterium]|nr:lysylphosphatidylglycerol synthase transmembrane domain-containing protein [Smithellaceae bacterium]